MRLDSGIVFLYLITESLTKIRDSSIYNYYEINHSLVTFWAAT